MPSANVLKPPVKYLRFWEFLYMELGLTKKKNNTSKGDSVDKLNLFLATPCELEKFLIFGVIACFDNFLCYLTIYPLKIVFFFVKILSAVYSHKSTKVLDKLMCSLGFDVIDYATQMIAHAKYGAAIDRVLNIHSLIMLFQLICLNVAVNAHNHLLFSLFISNQIVEIKGSVFKKFDRKNLVYMCNHGLYCSINNRCTRTIRFYNNDFVRGTFVYQIFKDLFFSLISELVVDWIKHSFIVKFNHINHKHIFIENSDWLTAADNGDLLGKI
ncbi:hypothetical protein MXB_232 [Myxobolus squamalis]|nr:hypothetical protein MXB_232 [Myxobolus squamalis]